MAFKEYRSPCRSSARHEFNIERFAYDVFAYMLRITGFPEGRIPTSRLKENNYVEDDFVRNVGLSCLPINLYKRDEWRLNFETIFEVSAPFENIVEIQNYLGSFLDNICELEDEENIGKIQFSLALYIEFTLFLNYKGVEICFDSFPTIWSRLCMRLIKEYEDIDQPLESSLSMCPDLSESWISNFIREFAIPYGNLNDISNRFSLLTFGCLGEELNCSTETSAERVSDVLEEFASQPTGALDEVSEPFSSKDSKPDMFYLPGRWNPASSSQLQTSEENALVEAKPRGRHTNGLTYVLKHCLNRRKRARSLNLDEDAFGRINLEKENISPESRDTKRRRELSGNYELE